MGENPEGEDKKPRGPEEAQGLYKAHNGLSKPRAITSEPIELYKKVLATTKGRQTREQHLARARRTALGAEG